MIIFHLSSFFLILFRRSSNILRTKSSIQVSRRRRTRGWLRTRTRQSRYYKGRNRCDCSRMGCTSICARKGLWNGCETRHQLRAYWFAEFTPMGFRKGSCECWKDWEVGDKSRSTDYQWIWSWSFFHDTGAMFFLSWGSHSTSLWWVHINYCWAAILTVKMLACWVYCLFLARFECSPFLLSRCLVFVKLWLNRLRYTVSAFVREDVCSRRATKFWSH